MQRGEVKLGNGITGSCWQQGTAEAQPHTWGHPYGKQQKHSEVSSLHSLLLLQAPSAQSMLFSPSLSCCFGGEMAAWRRGGIKRKRLFPVFPIICFRCISNSVPGVHITWSRNSYVWYVKSSRKKNNSAGTYCPSQKDTQSIPKKTFICSKITILYYLDRKTRCCVANIA